MIENLENRKKTYMYLKCTQYRRNIVQSFREKATRREFCTVTIIVADGFFIKHTRDISCIIKYTRDIHVFVSLCKLSKLLKVTSIETQLLCMERVFCLMRVVQPRFWLLFKIIGFIAHKNDIRSMWTSLHQTCL